MVKEEIIDFASQLADTYNEFISFFPAYVGEFFNFLILVLLVVAYSVFVWKFYRFVSRKNIFELNLNKYNKYSHPFLVKIAAGFFYLIEYIIILPFLIFFWFTVFTLFIIVLSQGQDISQILAISAIIIATIRITAYYKENLSQDIAKVLPFTLLAVSVLNPIFFTESQYVVQIINHFAEIPSFIGKIAYYLIFIIVLETLLRFFDFIFSLFGIEESVKEEGEE